MSPRLVLENFINFFMILVESFLGLRLVLKLLGANPSNAFVSWIYDMSDVLLDPFRGIFPARTLDNTFVLEFSTLFAMLMYLLGGILLLALVDSFVPTGNVIKKK
jgi:YggT family protein